MFSFLQNLFKKPSATSLAQEEYEDNKRSLLEHESQSLYHISMSDYYRQNIERLGEYLQNEQANK